MTCAHCGAKMIARWNETSGFYLSKSLGKLYGNPPPKVLDESVIEKVKSEMPIQPWEKGISKAVAKKVGISNSDMHRAIKTLIARGVFKNQINGVLYMPEVDNGSPEATKDRSSG